MPAKPSIFISYRRDPAADLARLIHDRLTARGYDVFLDVETINGGRFATIIQREIAARDVLLVILTPTTLESEWVRREVQTGFENNKVIVPLAAHGFSFGGNLPPEVSDLSNHDAVRWEHDFADAAFERLLRAVDPTSAGRKPRFNLSLAVGALSITCTAVILFAFIPTLLFNTSNAVPSLDKPTEVAIGVTSQVEIPSGEVVTGATANTVTPSPPQTTATQAIQAASTATELILVRTVNAQEATNAALMTENALIATGSLTPVPLDLEIGDRVSVSPYFGTQALRVREAAGRDSRVIASLDSGTIVTIIDGPQDINGERWWQIEGDNVEGWVVERVDGEPALEPLTSN